MNASNWARLVPAAAYTQEVDCEDREWPWGYGVRDHIDNLLEAYEQNELVGGDRLRPRQFAYVAAYIDAKNDANVCSRARAIKAGKIKARAAVAACAIGIAFFGWNGGLKDSGDVGIEVVEEARDELSAMSPEEQIEVVFNDKSTDVVVSSELPGTGWSLSRKFDWPILVPKKRLSIGQECLEDTPYDPSFNKQTDDSPVAHLGYADDDTYLLVSQLLANQEELGIRFSRDERGILKAANEPSINKLRKLGCKVDSRGGVAYAWDEDNKAWIPLSHPE